MLCARSGCPPNLRTAWLTHPRSPQEQRSTRDLYPTLTPQPDGAACGKGTPAVSTAVMTHAMTVHLDPVGPPGSPEVRVRCPIFLERKHVRLCSARLQKRLCDSEATVLICRCFR